MTSGAGGYSGSSYGRGGGAGPPTRSFEERAQAKEQMMASVRESSQQERRVYVGNLSYDVKWHHLKDFMRQGKIIHTPGKLTSWSSMVADDWVQRGRFSLPMCCYFRMECRRWASMRRDGWSFWFCFGLMDVGLTDWDFVRGLCRDAGKLISCTFRICWLTCRRIVEYATRDQAQQAVNTLSNQNLMGRLVYVREVRF